MRRFLFAVVLALLGVAAVLAAQDPAPNRAPAGTQTGRVLKPGVAGIVGRVVEAGTKTGVAGATVTLAAAGVLGTRNDVFSNGIPGGSRNVAADAQGQFFFRELPPGPYQILVSATGFADGAYGVAQIFGASPLANYRLLDLTDADRPVTIEIPLFRKGGISGRVIDEFGEPMIGVRVTVLARRSGWAGGTLVNSAKISTDDRGMYHVDVEPGEYIVGVIAATTTFPTTAVTGFLQAQQEGGATAQAYFTQISTSGSLLPRGVGARVGNFMVHQFGDMNAWVVPPFATRDGRLTFYPTTFHPSSPNGGAATAVTVASGQEQSGIDVRMRAAPARRISGRVIGPDGPVGGIALRLITEDSSATGVAIWNVAGDTPQALTDGNGEFTFIGVAPGAYTLRVLRSNEPADPVLWAAQPMTVGADDDVTGLTVIMQRGATISGRVIFEGTEPAPPAAALAGITIRAEPMPDTPGALMRPIGWAIHPEQSGRFVSGEMVPGPYVIEVANLPAGWVTKSVTVGGRNATGRTFDLTSAATSDVIVTFTDKVSSLTGTARDASGMPESEATIVVFPVDKSLWLEHAFPSLRIRSVAPGRDGRYSFRGLPAGEYFVTAVDAPPPGSRGATILNALSNGATRITIAEGESKTQDLRVLVVR